MNINQPISRRLLATVTGAIFLALHSSFLLAATTQELLHQLKNKHTKHSAMWELRLSTNPEVIRPLFELVRRDLEIDLAPEANVTSVDTAGCHCLGSIFRRRRNSESEHEINIGTQELINLYWKHETSSMTKSHIISCLGSIGSPVALPLLHQMIKENPKNGRAFMAIGDIGYPESIPVLKAVIDKYRPHGHSAALRALANMRFADPGKALVEICAVTPDSICDKQRDPKLLKLIKKILEREERRRLWKWNVKKAKPGR